MSNRKELRKARRSGETWQSFAYKGEKFIVYAGDKKASLLRVLPYSSRLVFRKSAVFEPAAGRNRV